MVTLLANFEEKLDVQNVEENMYMVNVNKMLYSNVVIVVAIIVQVGGCLKHKEAKDVQKCKIIYKVSYAEAVKKIEMEKKGSSLIVPPYTLEQSRETNTSNPISRVNYRIHPNERVQQVSRPRLNSQPSECCELKKKMSEETLLVKKNDFLAFICVVISKATELPQGSNKVKAIVDIANDFLGFRPQASKIQEILNSKYEGQNSD